MTAIPVHVIGVDVQAFDAVLEDIAALSVVADNEFLVGTAPGVYAHESGATVRDSLGLAAGLDGDIWVEKAEDTMSGALGIGGAAAGTDFLRVTGGGVQFDGTTGATPSDSDTLGTKFLWMPAKKALRIGSLEQTGGFYWPDAEIGIGSIGIGRNTWVAGADAVAIGFETYASRSHSLGLVGGQSTGINGIAIGKGAKATNTDTCAIGPDSISQGLRSLALGDGAGADGIDSAAIGGQSSTPSAGVKALSLGFETEAAADAAVAIGTYVITSGPSGFTIGTGVDAANRLLNTTGDIYIGTNSDIPSLIIEAGAGVGTRGNILVPGDDQKLLFGAGQDSSWYYDSADLVCDTAAVGSGVLKWLNSSNWAANSTGTVTISNLAPAGLTATIAKWLVFKDDGGVASYIPVWQ